MKNSTRFSMPALLGCALLCALLTACAGRPHPPSLYDFGPLRATPDAVAVPPISVADISAPAWLDNTLMFYRLAYSNDLQPLPYAGSRWTMTPSQLLGQRLKSRIAQAGGTVLSATDGAANVPLLRIEVDDFIQSFDSAAQSTGRLSLRASLFHGRTLVGQKTFAQQLPSQSADAPGGARALATASDAAITDIIAWLAQKKQ